MLLLLALVRVPLALAQEEVPAEGTIRTRSNLVLVPTLVKDAAGNIVYGLRTQDFEIEDDGVSQVVHLDESPEAEPLSLMIVVQTGRRASREFSRIQGLGSLLDPILTAPNTEAALLTFDQKLNLVCDFTTGPDVIEGALKQLERGDNGAAILDAVSYATKLLNKRARDRQRVLLLISETRDHGSHFEKLDDVVRLIGMTNTVVYALPFSPYASQQLDILRGSNRDEWQPSVDLLAKLAAVRNSLKQNTPKALAAMTGGEYELFLSQKGFESGMTGLSNHLHSRYLLSFKPKAPHPGLHRIQVHVKDRDGRVTVLYRNSYWAEEATP